MRPIVALVEARPETIQEDYERLLRLAGMDDVATAPRLVLAASAAPGWMPGRSSPPWQLAGVRDWLARTAAATFPDGVSLLPVGWQGKSVAALDPSWAPVLAAGDLHVVAEAEATRQPVRAHTSSPALQRVVRDGFRQPAATRDSGLVLLPVMDLGADWLLHGAVALLGRLLAPRLRRERRVPAAEVRAEIAGLAREMFPQLGVVLDGTVWHVAHGGGGQPVARNILLAGRDPVAVDAVALRLAGVDPLQVAWLRLCTERGFGAGDPAGIRLVGDARLRSLDFAIPDRTFASRVAGPAGGVVGWWRRLRSSLAARRRPVAAPWAELYREHREGRRPGVAT